MFHISQDILPFCRNDEKVKKETRSCFCITTAFPHGVSRVLKLCLNLFEFVIIDAEIQLQSNKEFNTFRTVAVMEIAF